MRHAILIDQDHGFEVQNLFFELKKRGSIFYEINAAKLDIQFPVDGLVEVRKELKGLAKERGIKLSYMPFFVKVRRERHCYR